MKNPEEPPRRTQAERRETTKQALLDAAIECMAETGYAGLTTRGVSVRAGVSQGGQQRYFPTKASLVAASFEHLVEEAVKQIQAKPVAGDTDSEKLEWLVDRIWEIHNLPAMLAGLDMLSAARSDVEIGLQIGKFMDQLTFILQLTSHTLFPELVRKPGFMDIVMGSVAAMRGTAVLNAVSGQSGAAGQWPAVRAFILQSIEAFLLQESAEKTGRN